MMEYFAATGMGNKLAGFVGQLSKGAGEFQVFTGIAIFCTLFKFSLAYLKTIKKINSRCGGFEYSKWIRIIFLRKSSFRTS